jgi:hypothetical protein
MESVRLVARAKSVGGIGGDVWIRRDIGDHPAVRAAEAKLAVLLSLDVEPLLVNGSMVPAAQQRKVGERRRATVGPVPDVMSLADPSPAARETTAAVPVVQRSP